MIGECLFENIPGFIVFITIILCLMTFMVYSWPIDSYQEIRYEHVRGQNTFSSCGPASLATLFAGFYGMKINEEKIINLVKPYIEQEIQKLNAKELPEGGVSMLDLKKVSNELGVPAKGYEIPQGKLFSVLETLQTPLLVHLDKQEEHFVLGIMVHRRRIVLADPSQGIRPIGRKEFFSMWDGLILAFSPKSKYRKRSKKVINEVGRRLKLRNRTQELSRSFLWTR